ncbi:MAG: aminopeptidase P family protein [Clostridiales bacterium]|nr:aminopeptidase P family protein [Clostridiales bacterium]
MFNNYDTLLIFDEDNRYYFSGFRSSFGCVILSAKKKVLITDSRYDSEARKLAVGFVVIQSSASNMYQVIAKQLELAKAKVLGFENDAMTVSDFEHLKNELPGYEFVPASNDIADKRVIKTEAEIEKITIAEEVTIKAFNDVIPSIKIGMSEKEVSDMITYAMLKNGASEPAFPNIVCFGSASACPHHVPSSDRKLAKNDIILIDIGAKVNGYCGDMTRTFCLGEPDKKLASIHKIVYEAQQFVLTNLKAGLTCREVDSMAREYLLAHGYKDEFSHSLGHGIGINVHERPYTSQRSEEVLKENMVISVEPGVYFEGEGGIRIEDIVVIKNDGIINLTNLSKEIKI